MDGSQEIENGNTRKACFFPEHVLNNPMILALKPSHLSKTEWLTEMLPADSSEALSS